MLPLAPPPHPHPPTDPTPPPSYIFPAVGHAAVLAAASAISDDVFLAAAEALAGMGGAGELAQGLLFPRFSAIKSVSLRLMAACADFMVGGRWWRAWRWLG